MQFDEEKFNKFLKDLKILPLFLIPIAGIALLIFAILGLSNDSGRTSVSEDDDYLTKNDATIVATIIKSSNEQVEIILEVADTESELEYGLMNRTFLGAEEGMLFVFGNSQQRTFWMQDTYIPLDIIFINDAKMIVTIYQNTEPLNTEVHYPSGTPVRYAIEVNGGWAERHNVKVGDKVLF